MVIRKRPELDLVSPPGQIRYTGETTPPGQIRAEDIDPRFAAAHYQEGRDLFPSHMEKPLDKHINDFLDTEEMFATYGRCKKFGSLPCGPVCCQKKG